MQNDACCVLFSGYFCLLPPVYNAQIVVQSTLHALLLGPKTHWLGRRRQALLPLLHEVGSGALDVAGSELVKHAERQLFKLEGGWRLDGRIIFCRRHLFSRWDRR